MSQNLQTLDANDLSTITGGTGTSAPAGDRTPTPAQDRQLRDLASRYCPTTSRTFQNTPVLTRPMGEQCLSEAGLSMFKGRLDQYFGPRTR
ncbi:MAG TPA: hypothetical protein VGM90_00060 [Kofleriaceae bacterium]|jgi:hypothetical protein